MLSRLRSRFNYASVAATLALVISMAGGAYALRVTGDDVVNDSLTGKDIREGTLKVVPNSKKLGGFRSQAFTRRCAPGVVVAGGWVLGPENSYDLSGYGTTYEEASGSFFGCMPITKVWIKRSAAGSYYVAFKPDRSNTLGGFGNVDNTYGNYSDAFISVGTALNTEKGEALSVEIRDDSGVGVDTPFYIYSF